MISLPLFLIPILAGLIAQALKSVFKTQRSTPANMPKYGGMPSAHAAFAVSLVTIVGLNDGIFDTSFALAVAFLVYTLDDALRMRIFLGRFGQAIGQLIGYLPDNKQKTMPYVEQRLGHTLPEVIVGSIIGCLISLAVFGICNFYNI